MRKVVLSVLVIGVMASAAAFAQTTHIYKLHDTNSCIGFYENLQSEAPAGQILGGKNFVAGWTDLADACSGYPTNSSNTGQKHGLNSTTPPHFFQTGSVLDVGDAYADAVFCFYCFSGESTEWILDLTHGQFAGYFSAGSFGGSNDYWWYESYLGSGLPSKGASPTRLPVTPARAQQLAGSLVLNK